MAPKIVKQKKVFLNQGNANNSVDFSRLEATAIAEIPTTVSVYSIYIDKRQLIS